MVKNELHSRHSLNLKLLIVGSGTWAQKIEAVCNEVGGNIEPKVISAREFLKNKMLPTENLETFDRIWICTRPSLQIEVLGKLSGYVGIVILEKPYAGHSQDFFTFFDRSKNMKPRIILSQPWTFSSGWNRFKGSIDSYTDPDFEISRVGQQMHSYINPVADWLPHDLNLILDLVEDSILEVELTKQQWSIARDRVQFQLSLNNTWNFTIDSGLNNSGRISMWKSKYHEIDFTNSVLTDNFGHQEVIIEKHPIIDFLNHYDDGKLQRIERDIRFHFEIMKGLGL